MKVRESGKTLIINGRKLVFDQRVDEMVTLEDRVIIRLLVGDFEIGDPLVGRNVLAFDKDGNMLWRIPTTGVMVRDPDGSEAPEAYFNLRLNSDGETINIASPDLTYDLDPETGKLSGGRVHR